MGVLSSSRWTTFWNTGHWSRSAVSTKTIT